MLHYEDPIDVLEALGYDPAFGSREWVDSYHVDDLTALSEALFYSQTGEVRWDRTAVNGDPFGKKFEELGKELMIDIAAASRSIIAPREVSPSYYTWRPGADYLVYKICEFFSKPRIEGMVASTLHVEHVEGNYIKISASSSYNSSQREELVELSRSHDYLSSAQLKGDLMRYMFRALENAERQRTCGYSIGYRPLYAVAVQFIDAIWGSIPELAVA